MVRMAELTYKALLMLPKAPTIALGLCLLSFAAIAQPILPAVDGTGTVVTPVGTQLNITGGQLSGDRANLFHSFQRFGLSASETANFLVTPDIINILSRVTGGDPSHINGLLQVTGGSANLYLLNPSGILLGPNARLNVPGSFTATTATHFGFSNGEWGLVGSSNYAQLVGNPTFFKFDVAQPGSIVNAGQLAVTPGQSLNLIGGLVINTGSLSAPAGQVTATAIPGSSLVRLSQPGSLLSLDVQPLNVSNAGITPASLPQLLTGGGQTPQAMGLSLNADGSVYLGSANLSLPVQVGTAVISGILSVTAPEGAGPEFSAGRGGQVNLLGDRVALANAEVNASGPGGGGTVLIGGDYLGQGQVPNARQTYISPGSLIRANATQQGNGGRVIVWGESLTQFEGQIIAKGGPQGGNGGFVETSARNLLQVGQGSVNVGASQGQAGTWLLDPLNLTITSNDVNVTGASPFTPTGSGSFLSFNTISTALITGDVEVRTTGTTGSEAGDIFINEPLNLTPPAARSLTFNAAGSIFVNQDITYGGFLFSNQTLNFNAGVNIEVNQTIERLNLGGGTLSVNMNAPNGSITINSDVLTNGGNFSSNSVTFTNNGSIITGGNSTVGSVGTNPNNGIVASGAIVAGTIDTRPLTPFSATSGQVNILSTGGSVSAADITTGGAGGNRPLNSGSVRIQAAGSITTGDIATVSEQFSAGPPPVSGAVTLQAAGTPGSSNVTFTLIDTSNTGFTPGIGGNVTISALGTVRGTEVDGTNSTIVTAYGTSTVTPGIVSITHDGGPLNLSFVVGDGTGAVPKNGLLGGITASNTPLTNTTFAMGASGNSVTTGSLNNITIASINSAPSLSASTPVSVGGAAFRGSPGGSFTFQLSDLSTLVSDSNNDQTAIFLTSVFPGATITTGGVALSPGSVLQSGLTYTYNIPVTARDNFTAFTIQAGDANNGSLSTFLSLSSPVQIGAQAFDVCDRIIRCDRNKIEVADTFPDARFLETAGEVLQRIEQETGKKPAVIYVSFLPDRGRSAVDPSLPPVDDRFTRDFAALNQTSSGEKSLPEQMIAQATERETDVLEIVMVTRTGRPLYRRLNVRRSEVLRTAREFTNQITSLDDDYQPPAEKLYRWLVAPLEDELKSQKIDTLLFSMDRGLRTLPVAALHDGQDFIIRRFSVGITPSFNLTDTRYQDIKRFKVLGMGASNFQTLQPLPAVPSELQMLQILWSGRTYLNQDFTFSNLRGQRQATPFGIIHLATHAEFSPEESFIQLWDSQLTIDRVRELGWANPPVSLLVLSACRTAIGNDRVELGFAGLAVRAGVKSVLASLWYVSDEGTMALMTEFYRQLGREDVTIKAEALRRAQLAILDNKVQVANGELRGIGGGVPLSAELAEKLQGVNLSHPYYWSAFSLVGSPW